MIEILDKDGFTYRKIKPIDFTELGDLSPDQYFGMLSANTPTKGWPICYDKQGDSFRLYPSPTSTAVSLTNGIRVTFKRTAVLFTAVSTTATDSSEPGLPSPYHVLLAYMAAIPYCMTYKKDRIALYQARVNDMKIKLFKFYGRREKDKKKIMRPKRILYI